MKSHSSRVRTDEELEEFANEYNILKKKGFYPIQIRSVICAHMNIGSTTYYSILSQARSAKLIKDSYIKLHAAYLRRLKTQKRKHDTATEEVRKLCVHLINAAPKTLTVKQLDGRVKAALEANKKEMLEIMRYGKQHK